MVYPKIKLKAARVNAEMTQEDVAKALNRNKQTIVNWEKFEVVYLDFRHTILPVYDGLLVPIKRFCNVLLRHLCIYPGSF